MSSHLPIGIFDSGIGGLSVLKELQLALPHEHFVYMADSVHAPYGDKDEVFIQQRVLAIVEFLSRQPVKAIVVACNTATATAVDILRSQFSTMPIVALEPAIKPAVLISKNATVGVLATRQTIASSKYQQLKSQYKEQATIIDMPCQGLVEYIELNKQDSAAFHQLLASYLQPLQNQDIDTLVLGCTHYPFVKKHIQKIIGTDIKIIDSGKAVAEQLVRQLKKYNILNTENLSGEVNFYSSVENKAFSHLWGDDIIVHNVQI